jgi:hypothetical protein
VSGSDQMQRDAIQINLEKKCREPQSNFSACANRGSRPSVHALMHRRMYGERNYKLMCFLMLGPIILVTITGNFFQ